MTRPETLEAGLTELLTLVRELTAAAHIVSSQAQAQGERAAWLITWLGGAAAQQPNPLSPEVTVWAREMQRELDANAHKDTGGGWRHCTPDVLWNDTMYHAMKLNYALKHGQTDKVCEFAADTANMAMMTREVYLARAESNALPPVEASPEAVTP